MAKLDLYIANPTKQAKQFSYFPINPDNVEHLVAHRHQAKFLPVPVGGQAKIADLEEIDLNFILKQHEQYGMIEATEVDRQRGRVDLIYSVDRPVPARAIEKAVHRNDTALAQLGKEVRQQAAVAGHQGLDQALEQYNTPTTLKALEVEVTEVARDQRDTSGEINEGVRVVSDPAEVAPPQRRRAKG